MKKKLLRTVTLKSGLEFKVGTMMELTFKCVHSNGSPWPGMVRATDENGKQFVTENLFNNFGFKPPTIKTMEKWSESGIARSVFGKKVEPDGYDSEGSPSWLLVMGLI